MGTNHLLHLDILPSPSQGPAFLCCLCFQAKQISKESLLDMFSIPEKDISKLQNCIEWSKTDSVSTDIYNAEELLEAMLSVPPLHMVHKEW